MFQCDGAAVLPGQLELEGKAMKHFGTKPQATGSPWWEGMSTFLVGLLLKSIGTVGAVNCDAIVADGHEKTLPK